MTAAERAPKAERAIALIGAPMEDGASQRGCAMGPAAFRTAGLAEALETLAARVVDLGDVAPEPDAFPEGAPVLDKARNVAEVAGWVRAVEAATRRAAEAGFTPVVMGGDHSVSAGSVAAMERRARALGRPLIVLWLDAHSDFNTFETSPSGNMHGMAVAAFCGLDGLAPLYDPALSPLATPPENVRMIGLRSVDPAERELLSAHGVKVVDMRMIDEFGVARFMREILETVARENALLHVSLDVDFLDPDVAPGVGTTVPGGATFREAHLIMEMAFESGAVSSLDLVELNPFLDDRGRSARVMVDLAASLFGRQVIDRLTRTGWSGREA